MSLESLTGDKYISDLEPLNPLSTDFKNQGDDHIRGIKNVLQKTFPNIDGPVLCTQGQLNMTLTHIIPTGGVILWPSGRAIFEGFLECDGSEISRASYPSLFGAIGEDYGAGNGTTTFLLPDITGPDGFIYIIASYA